MYTTSPNAPEDYAARWCEIVPEIKRIFPECEIGMPLAEYFSADPDIAAVRARTEQAEKIEAKGYFDASCMNQWSARFIKAMAPQLHNVSHVIYHSYGADAPFSATYWGLRRYRRFTEAFPELKGKKFWITEWRDRSDEEVPSHQRFRETLNKSAFMLMMAAHPDVDGMNLHEFRCQTGSLMWSNWDPKTKTGSWQVQWMNGGPDRPDFESAGESRAVVGSMGPAMQLMVESLLRYPVVMDFGSANYGAFSAGASNAVWACSDYYASVLDRRLGIRKGLATADLPKVKGDCEYLVTRSKDDTTHSRREVFSQLQNKYAVTELFREISPKIADRPGGYTRILKTGFRKGDNAEMCIIEFVDYNETYTVDKSKKKATRTRRSSKKSAAPAENVAAEAPVAEVEAPAAE